MRIVTWNVNSLKARQDFVSAYLDEESPDVLCLQELKLEEHKVPTEIFTSRGYHLAIFGQKQWNGVLIASKTPLEDVHRGLPEGDDGASRLIAATTAGVRFINLYCPQGQAEDSPKFPYKLGFYDALIAWLGDHVSPAEPALILGDLNIAPLPGDVYSVQHFENVPTYHPEEHKRWDRLCELGYADVSAPWLAPGTYTYWDYRGGKFKRDLGMRIDHHLATAPLAARVRGSRVLRQWRKNRGELRASDHAPVEITISSGFATA
ncbi:MAG: exodeoxyribonuclease III [Myxococcales bacterium]|nr:exodeoxyribonuclease III [Myxococcales bacterium]